MANPNSIILSVPTSGGGATAAATFAFATSGYKPPRQARDSSSDTVHNQNALFIYRYDNGPGQRRWEPFEVVITSKHTALAGGVGATQQLTNLGFLWQYIGPIGMRAPEGNYTVGWTSAPQEQRFGAVFPAEVGDRLTYDEMRVTINLEEAA